ncbi:hypothetical protein SCMU_29460 [Sinomonas cyclohexanicum]|uniref:Uncharacterized protein n=1 Tax=Sinomonas cyclohexanicum TaxID=322009 RepID=A0ABM7PY82_SINCY|nr:hypothetical protein SCMU_29460 [Corynebacterium cyclohexanicum]
MVHLYGSLSMRGASRAARPLINHKHPAMSGSVAISDLVAVGSLDSCDPELSCTGLAGLIGRAVTFGVIRRGHHGLTFNSKSTRWYHRSTTVCWLWAFEPVRRSVCEG